MARSYARARDGPGGSRQRRCARRTSPSREPAAGEVLVEVAACGICRTDLHVVDGELREPKLPLVPGHQIVGRVAAGGERFEAGQRVGVPWLGWTCGECRFCRSGRENLCDRARFTGYQRDGGFAAAAVADERFCFPIPEDYPGPPGRAAALRGADRPPGAAHGGRRRAARPLRLRGLGPHRLPGRAARGAARVRLHARRTTARRRSSPASSAPSGPATPSAPPPEELDAAIVFAPVGELVPGGAARRRQGRHGGLRRHPHERPAVDAVRAALGRAHACARWPT